MQHITATFSIRHEALNFHKMYFSASEIKGNPKIFYLYPRYSEQFRYAMKYFWVTLLKWFCMYSSRFCKSLVICAYCRFAQLLHQSTPLYYIYVRFPSWFNLVPREYMIEIINYSMKEVDPDFPLLVEANLLHPN